jgi:hypothetical protein
MIYVIPAAGLSVPDPAFVGTPLRHLPPEGRLVQEAEFWTRRLRDGDVTIGVPAAEDAAGHLVVGAAIDGARTELPSDADLAGDGT